MSLSIPPMGASKMDNAVTTRKVGRFLDQSFGHLNGAGPIPPERHQDG